MMRAVIAIVVVLVVVAGIVVLQPKEPVAQPLAVTPQTDAMIVRPETHVIDCGKPDYIEDKYVEKDGASHTVLEIGTSMEGEKITFLHSPKWIGKCNLDDVKKDEPSSAGKLAGLAVYKFDVERDDVPYYVFLSAKWTDTCGNSVWVLVNGPEKGGHGPEDGKYEYIKDQLGFVTEKDYKLAWHPLIKEGKPLPVKLKKGANSIELHTRQDGPRFDQLVITTEANAPAVNRLKPH